MAATLGPGSQSTLMYANKLIMPVLAISSTALGTAALPYFSRLVAKEDWDGLRQTLSTYTRLILAVAIPATVTLILLSRPLVRLLFERGEFTADDTDAVARVLATYSLLIPIETIAVMMSRVLLSLQIGKIMVLASIGIFLSNIVCDYVLKEILGIEGIALASVVNQVLSLIFLIFMWRHLQRTRMKPT
jgi:putative peptidoglycan lipid II flippase